MKRLAFALILSMLSFSTMAKEGIFSANITGIDSATIKVTIIPMQEHSSYTDLIFDEIKCINGAFEYHVDFNLNLWHLVRLESKNFKGERPELGTLKNQSIAFFMRPGDEISVSAKISEYGINYKVCGNDINAQMNEVSNQLFPIEEEYNRLIILKENPAASGRKMKIEELESKIEKVSNKIKELQLGIIESHPEWLYSVTMLPDFPLDTISKYFGTLDPKVKNTFFGEYVAKMLNGRVNSVASEFTLPNQNGREISLSTFKGKHIVLYFWGTWCGVCIKGIPEMNEYHSRYRDKVEFISISCRDSKDTWLKAIEKNDLNWVNLIAQNSEVSDNYGVEGYPTKIIIDPSGTIIHKSVGNSDEFYNKLDELFNMKN